ncbi:hypothetical protein GEU84_017595 [Fertoebacter nigrum]|uniref:Uncharacterized protein n=1 Tax=Fertoeibacter niger TaxID=2656921 RepID=A0A8X8H2Z5_9RHOB|nr:hypothetical protein [Fertoeibacter niger]NUB46210.1 hypothetical protein [Fertoeibacter niger]
MIVDWQQLSDQPRQKISIAKYSHCRGGSTRGRSEMSLSPNPTFQHSVAQASVKTAGISECRKTRALHRILVCAVLSIGTSTALSRAAEAQHCDFILCGQGHRQYCEPQCRGGTAPTNPFDDAVGDLLACLLMPSLPGCPGGGSTAVPQSAAKPPVAPHSPYSIAANPDIPLRLPEDKRWIIVASGRDRVEVVGRALEFAEIYGTTQVFVTSDGIYAATIGWDFAGPAERAREELVRTGQIPEDSFLSRGMKHVDRVWATDALMAVKP